MNKDDLDWLARIAEEWLGMREDVEPIQAKAARRSPRD